ncbi:MAG: O-antigen ligase family protein [Actinomycetota bacterium]
MTAPAGTIDAGLGAAGRLLPRHRSAYSPRFAAPATLGFAIAIGLALLIGPTIVVLGLLAVALTAAALWRPDVATITFFFVMFANLLAVATQFHGAPSIAAGGFVLILGIPLLHHLVISREPVVVTPAVPLILCYLLAMIVAAAASSSVTEAARPIGDFVLEGLLIFLLVINVVRSASVLRHIIWAIVLAAALMGSLSLVQEAAGAYDNDFGGLAQVTDQGFKVGEDRQGKVLRPRLSGPIGEQNRYAQILLVAAPLALFRLKHESDRRLRALAAGSLGAILGGILLTFSRGATVAMFGLFILLLVRRHIRLRHAVAGLLLATVAIFVVEPDYAVRLSSLARIGAFSTDSPDQQVDGAILGRATSNLAAWEVFVDHPITGVGPERYFREYSQQVGNDQNLRHFDKNRRAHNLYLETAADLGLLGIGALLGAVGVTALHLGAVQRYWRSRRPELAALASSMLFALAAYLATGVFLHLAYQRYFWMLLGLANATAWVLGVERRNDRRAGAQRAPVR